MKERTIRVLEFTRIREMLAEGALTAAGKERCLALEPFCDLPSVRAAQEETEEAAVILQYTGGHPMTEFPDIRPALAICEKGGSLSAGMLLSIAGLLRASRAARDALVTDRENTPILRGRAEELTEKLRAAGPLFMDLLPLNLEEIFIYELGGAEHEVKRILL